MEDGWEDGRIGGGWELERLGSMGSMWEDGCEDGRLRGGEDGCEDGMMGGGVPGWDGRTEGREYWKRMGSMRRIDTRMGGWADGRMAARMG